MSYQTSTVHCEICSREFNIDFGIVDTSMLADWSRECPSCGGRLVKIADGWKADEEKETDMNTEKEWWMEYIENIVGPEKGWMQDRVSLIVTEASRRARLEAYEHLLKTASGGGSWRRICEMEMSRLADLRKKYEG